MRDNIHTGLRERGRGSADCNHLAQDGDESSGSIKYGIPSVGEQMLPSHGLTSM
jgi:hypothetical protein